MGKRHDARYNKLQGDFTDLMNLANRSDFIKIEPVDVEPGWPPEKYLITFTCAGVSAIQSDGIPVVSTHHEVEMYLSAEYPVKIPALLWRTDIWHPNIDHQVPRHVCTNDVQTFFSSKPLSEVVLFMAEMVQYRRYHAKLEAPFPLDLEAARWVREVAEPRGWIAPDHPFDSRPLLREHRIVTASPEEIAVAKAELVPSGHSNGLPGVAVPSKKGMGIQLGQAKTQEAGAGAQASQPGPRRPSRISLGSPRSE